MSLILDALRKAEAERKLGRAPTLASNSPWRVQRRVPLYAVVMIVLLGAVAVLAGLLWFTRREPAPPKVASAPETVVSAPARAPSAPASIRPAAPESTPSPTARPSEQPSGPARAPVQAAAPQAKPPRPAPPPERLPTVVPATPPVPHLQPEAAAPGGTKSSPPPRQPAPSTDAIPPADKLPPPPARFAPPPPQEPVSAHLMPAGPPSAAARSALGELKLTMHYYNADPARRFVILDGERYGEGQSTPKGMKVAEIRADGVLGEYQGETFFLSRASGG